MAEETHVQRIWVIQSNRIAKYSIYGIVAFMTHTVCFLVSCLVGAFASENGLVKVKRNRI
jgi:hypothetical protein